jgi:DNA-binding NarL/FixJ family response regulator
MNTRTVKQINILLVDDVSSVRKGLSTVLQLMDDLKIVGEAKNGLEAVQLAKQLTPDVILMDLAMPELDGFEATERIKADLPQIGIITFSIHDDANTREKACAAGADAFVEKEAETELLIAAIREVSDKTANRWQEEKHDDS